MRGFERGLPISNIRTLRLLVLGGTSEASALALRLAARADIAPVLSLAGRTKFPAPPPIPHRTGGFGGIDGLRDYLAREKIDAVIDATHPFAAQMSANALAVCAQDIPLLRFTRPPWQAQPGDTWTGVADIAAAAAALGTAPARVFLTHGRELAAFAQAPQHDYLVRTIEPPDGLAALPRHRLVLARGPFALDAETRLMRAENIEILVTKNSGGTATYAKIAAARTLGIRVVMIARPPGGGAETHDLEEVLRWIDRHRPAP